jgi:hypothetical protein
VYRAGNRRGQDDVTPCMGHNKWKHFITIAPGTTSDGTREWYASVHEGAEQDSDILAGGSGETITLALCDLIDNLAPDTEEWEI